MEQPKHTGADSGKQSDNLLNDASTQTMVSRKSIDEIELALVQLSDRCSLEVLIEWLNLTELLGSRAKLMRKNVERVAVEWITVHGPLNIGDVRYIVGYPKSVTCVDVVRCTHAILDACGGEIDALCAYLRSDPYKYGSVSDLLGAERFAQLFRVEHRPKLVEGKPQKQLLRVDRRYLK